MEKKMFYHASPLIFQRAKALRNQPTDAERILWSHLQTEPGGYKFRRQHPAGNYILDFYCNALKIAIEVDGSIHLKEDVLQADNQRQEIMEEKGIKFMRFTNKEVMTGMPAIIKKLSNIIEDYAQRHP